MIQRSRHLEALIRKHWRTLARGDGGVWLDCYNCSGSRRVSGTITTRIDASCQYFITERTNAQTDTH